MSMSPTRDQLLTLTQASQHLRMRQAVARDWIRAHVPRRQIGAAGATKELYLWGDILDAMTIVPPGETPPEPPPPLRPLRRSKGLARSR